MDCKAKKIKPHESHTTTQFNWETINHYVSNFSMFLGPFNIYEWAIGIDWDMVLVDGQS